MALSVIGGKAVHADIENTATVVDDDSELVALRLPTAFTTEDAEPYSLPTGLHAPDPAR